MNDPLSVIYNENFWRVNRLSPMYNLKYNELKLKQYATTISQELAIDANNSSTLTVSMISLPLLKYRDRDPNGLKIEVTSSWVNRLNSQRKVVYAALLLSWDTSTNDVNGVTTHLPYMLERGEKKVGEAVKNAMQRMFDCSITQFNFNKMQLMQFMVSFIAYDTSRDTDSIVLGYKTQFSLTDKCTFTFDIGDVRTILTRIYELNDQDDIPYVYQVFMDQICDHFEMDVTMLDLCHVALPKAEVKSSGVVKMKSPEIINSVFKILDRITASYNLLLNDV